METNRPTPTYTLQLHFEHGADSIASSRRNVSFNSTTIKSVELVILCENPHDSVWIRNCNLNARNWNQRRGYIGSQLQGVRHQEVPKAKKSGWARSLNLRLAQLQGTSRGQMLGGPILTEGIKINFVKAWDSQILWVPTMTAPYYLYSNIWEAPPDLSSASGCAPASEFV